MAIALLSTSCALQFKVQENWRGEHARPIPLEDARSVWETIRRGGMPEETELEEYNRTVRKTVVRLAHNWTSNPADLSRLPTTTGEVDLEIELVNARSLSEIDQAVPADFIKIRRGFDSETVVDGVGSPLMVRKPWTESDPMIPKTGLWFPVTAVLDLDRPEQPVLRLVDPTKKGALTFNGHEFPLRANYTATFARDFQDRQFQFREVRSLLNFDKYADRMGLYRISSFAPNKQVCILVHGINSTPMTWHKTLNQLYGHEDIRERYEFWTLGYPTGAPIPFLAAKFRQEIRDMVAFRKRNGARDNDLVIVGHSLGGLLAKAVTQHGDDENWNKFFKVPIEELDVSEEHRETLRSMVYYEPLPWVDRVVFCATPHRGTKFAENPIARLIGDLVQLPTQLDLISQEVGRQSRYALTPLGLEIAKNRPTSLDQLRFEAAEEFLDRPLNPAVKYHSIMGSDDDLVTYDSAHVEGTESETVIQDCDHGVHRNEEGIEEIARILKLP